MSVHWNAVCEVDQLRTNRGEKLNQSWVVSWVVRVLVAVKPYTD